MSEFDENGRISGGSRNYEKRGGVEGSVWALSYFIANAHNEFAFYTGKGDYWKNSEASRGLPDCLPSPFEFFISENFDAL